MSLTFHRITRRLAAWAFRVAGLALVVGFTLWLALAAFL